MNTLGDILKHHPRESEFSHDTLVSTLGEIANCAGVCGACADACLAEPEVDMLRKVIRATVDCAAICEVTAKIAGARTESDARVLAAQMQACVTACEVCAAECRVHAQRHEHCRICAETCDGCIQVCNRFMQSMRLPAVH